MADLLVFGALVQHKPFGSKFELYHYTIVMISGSPEKKTKGKKNQKFRSPEKGLGGKVRLDMAVGGPID